MYWQGLSDDELLRYADGNHEGQLEIARRVLAGQWREDLKEQIAQLEHDLEAEKAEVVSLEAVIADLEDDIATLETQVEDLKSAAA